MVNFLSRNNDPALFGQPTQDQFDAGIRKDQTVKHLRYGAPESVGSEQKNQELVRFGKGALTVTTIATLLAATIFAAMAASGHDLKFLGDLGALIADLDKMALSIGSGALAVTTIAAMIFGYKHNMNRVHKNVMETPVARFHKGIEGSSEYDWNGTEMEKSLNTQGKWTKTSVDSVEVRNVNSDDAKKFLRDVALSLATLGAYAIFSIGKDLITNRGITREELVVNQYA